MLNLISEYRYSELTGGESDNYYIVSRLYADGQLEDLLRHDLLHMLPSDEDAAIVWQRWPLFNRDEHVWLPAIRPGHWSAMVTDDEGNEHRCDVIAWRDSRGPGGTSGYVFLPDDHPARLRAQRRAHHWLPYRQACDRV